MNASVGIVTRNGTNAVTRATLSAMLGSDDVIVINNDCTQAHIVTSCDAINGQAQFATFINFTESAGLAKCWNTIVRGAIYDWVVLANDDVKFDDDWLAKLERCLLENPDARHVGMAYPSNRYSGFAVHKSLIADIGWFDERFTGMFFEDEDWHLRMSEHSREHVSKAWAAGRHDLITANCDAILHKHDLKDPGSGGGLSRADNEAWFKQKWESCDYGWWTKGKVGGRYLKMRRRVPEVDWYGAQK